MISTTLIERYFVIRNDKCRYDLGTLAETIDMPGRPLGLKFQLFVNQCLRNTCG